MTATDTGFIHLAAFMRRVALPAIGALLLTAAAAYAQTTPSIVGVVSDLVTQQPLRGATVRVEGSSKGAITDADGRFAIEGLEVGTWQLRVTYVGYDATIVTDIVVTNVRPATVDVRLRPAPRRGDTIIVRPDYFQRNADIISSTRTLSSEEIRRLPGGFEDVVRAISSLPGVAQVSNARNDLLVRGGAPSENLYIIDNIEAPNINHFGTQGSGGGPLSFINLDFVQSTTFSTGGFGARYGDRISSVLTLDLRDGRSDRQGGKGTISATQFGLNLEGPVTRDATYFFSARRSYLDLIFRAAGFSFVPEYWDFLGKATWKLGGNDQISALAIGAIDRVRFFAEDEEDRFENSRILDNSQDQLVAGLSWRHLFASGFVTTTLGRTRIGYDFKQVDTLEQVLFTNSSVEDELSLRSDAVVAPWDGGEIGFGAGVRSVGFDADIFLAAAEAVRVAPSERFWKAGAYMQIANAFPFGLTATLGGRVDLFSGINEQLYPTLRLALSQSLGDRTTLTLSGGRYYQAPSYIWLAATDLNRDLRAIRADVGVLGIERLLAEDLRLSLEGYYKEYGDYPASLRRPWLVLANTGTDFGGADDGYASFGLEPLASRGSGRAYGLELLLQKKLSDVPFYGVASVAVGRSRFTAIDGVERPSSFEQELIANLSGGYRFDRNWEAGVRFRFASGRPYTPVGPTGDPSSGFQIIDLYNARRLPATHALDVRVDRRWSFTSWNLIAYIDVQNVYNRKNSSTPRYNARLQAADNEESSIGILPSIGISAEW